MPPSTASLVLNWSGSWENEEDPVKLLNQLATNIPMDYKERQRILEAVDIQERFETLISLMDREVDIIRINKEISAKVKERVDKSQREYVLREQLRSSGKSWEKII